MVLFHFFDEEDKIYDEEAKKSIKVVEKNIDNLDESFIDYLNEYQIYNKQIAECKSWFDEYETNSKSPRVLMLVGKKGCGKTLLAQLLLKNYGYEKKDIIKDINDDQFSKKQINEMIKNSFIYKNFNEYNNQKYGFIFDDIELMLDTGDNIIFNEIMSMIKSSKKSEIKKTKNELKELESKSKNKRKSTKKDEQKEGYVNDIIIYNPIICTCNYTNDKKMNEFKKLCKVIELNMPSEYECDLVLEHFKKIYKVDVNQLIKGDIYEYCDYDIRKIKNCIYQISKFNHFHGTITRKEFHTYQLIFGKMDIHCQLNEATYRILNTPLTIPETEILYSADTLLTPLMIHHNLIDYIKNCGVNGCKDKNIEFETKFDVYEKCIESICEYDKVQTSVYRHHDWDLLPNLASYESLYVPNYHLRKLNYLNNGKFKIQFTNILNKISQLEVNKKMIQNSYFSLNRIIIDDDELMYIIEIFLNYLKINRIEENDEDENMNETVDEEVIVKKERQKKSNIVICNDLNNSEYKKIIQIMNKYNIDVKSLESILKIEKLNLFENKNPKRLTSKTKEELEYFVTAQSLSIEEE